jgi:anti-sigma factor RsiW
MSNQCASFDLKAYRFGEASAAERQAVEQHVRACPPCGDELARLEFTRAALMSVRDEEMPRRIAFVSDKVFEPKWYQRPLGAVWGFASAAALAGAIVFHALWHPGTVISPSPMAAAVRKIAVPPAGLSQAAVASMIDAAVKTATAEVSARGEQSARQLLADAEKRHDAERAEMMGAINASFEVLTKKYNNALKMTASVSSNVGAER